MLAEKEIRLARQCLGLFRSQGDAVAKAFEAHGISEAIETAKFYEQKWFRLLAAHYTVTGNDFGLYTAKQIGLDKQKNLGVKSFLDFMQEFVLGEGLRKSSLINQTTIETIRGVIDSGTQEGLGPREIAGKIRSRVADEEAIYRSDIIARTETHNAATYDGQSSAEASGLELEREWVTSIDGRERPEHREADEQRRELKEDFYVGGEYISRPGEGSASNAINCRCSIIYDPKR